MAIAQTRAIAVRTTRVRQVSPQTGALSSDISAVGGICPKCNVLKQAIVWPDGPIVANFSTEVWLACAVVGVACITCILHSLSKAIAAERDVHDLRLRVFDLRTAYTKRLADAEALHDAEVDREDRPPNTAANVERTAA